MKTDYYSFHIYSFPIYYSLTLTDVWHVTAITQRNRRKEKKSLSVLLLCAWLDVITDTSTPLKDVWRATVTKRWILRRMWRSVIRVRRRCAWRSVVQDTRTMRTVVWRVTAMSRYFLKSRRYRALHRCAWLDAITDTRITPGDVWPVNVMRLCVGYVTFCQLCIYNIASA